VDKKTTFALEINIPELVRTWLILLFPLKLSTTADLHKNRERDLGLTSAGLIMVLEVPREELDLCRVAEIVSRNRNWRG
jgi:hypothetical protein